MLLLLKQIFVITQCHSKVVAFLFDIINKISDKIRMEATTKIIDMIVIKRRDVLYNLFQSQRSIEK